MLGQKDDVDVMFGDGGSGVSSEGDVADDDELFGGYGDDTLIGGQGNDLMFGNRGADKFVFTETSGQDTIVGWESSDLLDFSGMTATAGSLSIDAPTFGFDQITCFDPTATASVQFTIRQVDNDTYIYLGNAKEIDSMAPTVILQNTDANTLSIDDFIFS